MFHLNVQDDNDDVLAYMYVTKPTMVIIHFPTINRLMIVILTERLKHCLQELMYCVGVFHDVHWL